MVVRDLRGMNNSEFHCHGDTWLQNNALKQTTCLVMQTQARLQRGVSFANRIRVHLKKAEKLVDSVPVIVARNIADHDFWLGKQETCKWYTLMILKTHTLASPYLLILVVQFLQIGTNLQDLKTQNHFFVIFPFVASFKFTLPCFFPPIRRYSKKKYHFVPPPPNSL
ncbi:hypothetical protein YC2023_060937 [Brassica napus]